ncbi:uncharacterized protein VK521_004206 [Ammospiza maritima maritima]
MAEPGERRGRAGAPGAAGSEPRTSQRASSPSWTAGMSSMAPVWEWQWLLGALAGAPGDQGEEAKPGEEEDEEVWEDGDSGHQRLGKAQLQRKQHKMNAGRDGGNHPGAVWAGSLVSEPVLGWLLSFSHSLQVDVEVMEMCRECCLVFPASGNLAIQKTN